MLRFTILIRICKLIVKFSLFHLSSQVIVHVGITSNFSTFHHLTCVFKRILKFVFEWEQASTLHKCKHSIEIFQKFWKNKVSTSCSFLHHVILFFMYQCVHTHTHTNLWCANVKRWTNKFLEFLLEQDFVFPVSNACFRLFLFSSFFVF